MTDRPLATFIVVAYNQEAYIRDAVAGAFAQTYSPLQIILSDDCSTDATYDIMAEEAAKYTGQHEITLNRNPVNLGIGAHVNRVVSLSKGELIVASAGDDISLGNRTAELVDVWLASNKTAMSIHSAAIKIDANGNEIGMIRSPDPEFFDRVENLAERPFYFLGATHAFAKKIYDVFGPLRDEVTHEDNTLPLRSALLGSIRYIDQPLVQYRYGVGVSANFNDMPLEDAFFTVGARVNQRHYISCLQRLDDLHKINASSHLITLAEKRLAEQGFITALSNKSQIGPTAILRALRKGVQLKWLFKNLLVYKLFPIYKVYMVLKKARA